MNYKTFIKLKVGTRIKFKIDNVLGTLKETGYCGGLIVWDDGQAMMVTNEYNEFDNLEVVS